MRRILLSYIPHFHEWLLCAPIYMDLWLRPQLQVAFEQCRSEEQVQLVISSSACGYPLYAHLHLLLSVTSALRCHCPELLQQFSFVAQAHVENNTQYNIFLMNIQINVLPTYLKNVTALFDELNFKSDNTSGYHTLIIIINLYRQTEQQTHNRHSQD